MFGTLRFEFVSGRYLCALPALVIGIAPRDLTQLTRFRPHHSLMGKDRHQVSG